MRPRPLAVTLGDPAGIGPEIVFKAWTALRANGPPFMAIGDCQVLATSNTGSAQVRSVLTADEAISCFPDSLPVLDLPLRTPVVAGQPNSSHAGSIIRWIETGVGMALSGVVSGLVTAPIAKAQLYQAGFAFPGHTEFLAELTSTERYDGARGPIMMLTAPGLRTALVTIHEPLAKVAQLLTPEKIAGAGIITAQALRRDFGIASPRIAIAGLNPHAGEGGALGREEIEVIAPAVAALREHGIDAFGPRPADTLFHPQARATYDAVICMYHDQALIPVKMLDFFGGVNVTLGLPIVRTSPDHGTAFELAGRGQARADSLIAAIRMAAEIADQRAKG